MSDRLPKILIIDDDQGFCILVAKSLRRSNFEVVCIHSATEGLAFLKDNVVDAVVLDHVLPEQDGLSLLNAVQSFPYSPPVVYLTGSQESSVAVAALKAGASDYVVKDLHGEFLILLENAVVNAMRSAALKRDKEKAEDEVRAARDKFKALADERALMLREVNHRISNSLQLIVSMLHIQSDVSNDDDIKAALKEANARVQAVARVHRSLYTSFDMLWVSLSDYLSPLLQDMQAVSTGETGPNNSITLTTDPIQVSPDVAVAIGIVVTELVLNAIKHGYANRPGPVRVMAQARDGVLDVIVEDDGRGGLPTPSEKKRAGLGQRIIAGMAHKLDGELRYERLPAGWRATMTVPARDDIRVATSATHMDMAIL